MTCMTAIIIIMLLSIFEGYLIAVFRECYRRETLRRYHEETGKPDEEIVCENAMVVFDGKEISWYDKDKSMRWRKI